MGDLADRYHELEKLREMRAKLDEMIADAERPPILVEPSNGRVIKFGWRPRPSAKRYTFAAIRIPDDDPLRWYLTGSDAAREAGWGLPSPMSWEAIVKVAEAGSIEVAPHKQGAWRAPVTMRRNRTVGSDVPRSYVRDNYPSAYNG